MFKLAPIHTALPVQLVARKLCGHLHLPANEQTTGHGPGFALEERPAEDRRRDPGGADLHGLGVGEVEVDPLDDTGGLGLRSASRSIKSSHLRTREHVRAVQQSNRWLCVSDVPSPQNLATSESTEHSGD